MTSEPQLEAAWDETARAAGVSGAQVNTVFADLCGRYSESHRHYHTLRHVSAMLTTLAPHRGQCKDVAALELAVWFHDAVYDARRGDNEEESAAHVDAVLAPVGVSETTRDRVRGLILATKTHTAPPGDTDCRMLLDADLAIFGATPGDYDAYAQAIRREYDWVSEADYRAGRARILRGFLDRERLFHTDALSALEQPARANLSREIEWLTQ